MAQVFQLIRGGRDPALQIRPTLSVLKLLVERQLITDETENELRQAYVFYAVLSIVCNMSKTNKRTCCLAKQRPKRVSR